MTIKELKEYVNSLPDSMDDIEVMDGSEYGLYGMTSFGARIHEGRVCISPYMGTTTGNASDAAARLVKDIEDLKSMMERYAKAEKEGILITETEHKGFDHPIWFDKERFLKSIHDENSSYIPLLSRETVERCVEEWKRKTVGKKRKFDWLLEFGNGRMWMSPGRLTIKELDVTYYHLNKSFRIKAKASWTPSSERIPEWITSKYSPYSIDMTDTWSVYV